MGENNSKEDAGQQKSSTGAETGAGPSTGHIMEFEQLLKNFSQKLLPAEEVLKNYFLFLNFILIRNLERR